MVRCALATAHQMRYFPEASVLLHYELEPSPYFMCENPCMMGVPPGAGAYEWVFSFPACLYWDKTNSNDTHWCLTSCGDRYCVHAVAVVNGGEWGRDKDGNMIFIANVVEHVTGQFEYTPRGCAQENRCTSDGCLENFKPNCSGQSGKVNWDLLP